VKRARRRAILLGFIAASGAAALALTAIRNPPPTSAPTADRRPILLLLTSLPLMFSEDFGLQGSGSPALKALQRRFKVVPISSADGSELAKGHLLLMAQPQAQTAENLVVLDQWVRRGGRVLLLADPLLEWPSKLPLGDLTRPAPMFMDTGLLAHWGLTLEAPERRGAAERKLAGRSIMTVSPGALRGTCAISPDRLLADCNIGAGKAAIVADADFLNSDRLGSDGAGNPEALLAELARLELS
jgi:hypothetical protein